MPCRCGMVKLMRLDIRETTPPKQKSARAQMITNLRLKERIRRMTNKQIKK
jgi:hypothetical protein